MLVFADDDVVQPIERSESDRVTRCAVIHIWTNVVGCLGRIKGCQEHARVSPDDR